MNVFTEWHHGGLFHSQQLLWEKRLGNKLFGPVGFEWAEAGIWRLSTVPSTIKQYLDPADCELREDGFYYHYDPGEEIWQRRVTLDQFRAMNWEIILCTLQEHEESFLKLRDENCPAAMYIRLVGNTGEQVNWSRIKNFIDTTGLYLPPPGINAVQMAQEFDLTNFTYEAPENPKTIINLMNCLPEADAFAIWNYLKRKLPDYKFLMFGGKGEDGNLSGLKAISEALKGSGWLFQVKHHGEGFGHVIHNAFACGRPSLTVFEYYRGKMAGRYMRDQETCLMFDNKDPEEVVKEIRYFSEPERHRKMCEACRAEFEKYIDFDRDEANFRQFLARLQY